MEGRESYRVLAKEVYERTGRKISPTSLQRMVDRIGRRCKSAWEMSQELRPRWDGFLLFDEKMCSVRDQQLWFYVAVDRTGDILHCRAVKELTVTEASEFLREVKDLGVKCRGVVTDLDTSLSLAVEGIYGGIPHQYCLKHALGAIEKLLGYRGLTSRQGWNRRSLRQSVWTPGGSEGSLGRASTRGVSPELGTGAGSVRAVSEFEGVARGLWECVVCQNGKTGAREL